MLSRRIPKVTGLARPLLLGRSDTTAVAELTALGAAEPVWPTAAEVSDAAAERSGAAGGSRKLMMSAMGSAAIAQHQNQTCDQPQVAGNV